MISIPSTSTLYNRLVTAFQTTFGVTLPSWGINALRIMSLVLGREFRLQYLGIASLQKNIWVDTCDAETLLRFGKVKLGRYPFAATQGRYECTVTGTAGAVIPAQTTFRSDDSSQSPGHLYILDSAYTMTGTADVITLRALDAGTVARLSVGNTLTSTSPIFNVDSQVAVYAELAIPNDEETTKEYRAKVLASFQLQPSGDNAVTYRELGSLNVNGVRQIYPYTTSGAPNEVDIYIEATKADSTDGKGTPTSTITTDVTNSIEASRPLGVFQVNYYPITLKEVNININMTGLTPLSSPQRDLVYTALTLFIDTVRPFIAAADATTNRNDSIGLFNIGPAIAGAIPGVPFGAITFTVAGSTVVNYLFDNGEIPWLNNVTYI